MAGFASENCSRYWSSAPDTMGTRTGLRHASSVTATTRSAGRIGASEMSDPAGGASCRCGAAFSQLRRKLLSLPS
jgi:hypothetical protein